MGNCCAADKGGVVGCLRRTLCGTYFVFFFSSCACLSLGITLAGSCISELCILFVGQTLLLLLWLCFRKPRTFVTWGYVFLCSVLLVRESILVLTGSVPCGLATASNCQESRCVEHSKILWTSTSCRRRECVRYFPAGDDQKFMQIHSVPAEEVRTSWLISAHICVWSTFLISIFQLLRWHAAAKELYSVPRPQPHASSPLSDGDGAGLMTRGRQPARANVEQPISLIICCPLTYGLCAAHALRKLTIDRADGWSAEAMLDAAELYSSIALYAFQRLLVLYIDRGLLPGLHIGGSVVVDVTAVEGEALELRQSLQRLVAAGIKQYIFLAFAFNSIEVTAKVWNWWHPSSCTPALARVATMFFPRHRVNMSAEEEMSTNTLYRYNLGSAACADLWNVTSLLLVVADFFTCSIALFAIWSYERTFAIFFHPMKPFLKFLGVKGMLSVGWLQAMVLVIIGFAAESGKLADENFRTFVNYHLVCVESLLLGCLNIFAYPPTPPPWCATGLGMPDTTSSGLEDFDSMDLRDLGLHPDTMGKEEL